MLEPNSTVSAVPWLAAFFFGAAFLGADLAATETLNRARHPAAAAHASPALPA